MGCGLHGFWRYQFLSDFPVVLQAEYALKEREGPLNNVKAVGTKMKAQYQERCEAYQALFESVNTSVSRKFRNYMQRRQHEVRGVQ